METSLQEEAHQVIEASLQEAQALQEAVVQFEVVEVHHLEDVSDFKFIHEKNNNFGTWFFNGE